MECGKAACCQFITEAYQLDLDDMPLVYNDSCRGRDTYYPNLSPPPLPLLLSSPACPNSPISFTSVSSRKRLNSDLKSRFI